MYSTTYVENSNSNLNSKTFPALKSLIFFGITEIDFESIKNVLMNVENISLCQCDITGEIVDQLVNCCPKLKWLRVSYCSIAGAASNVWFSKNYPALEHLEFRHDANIQIDQLKMFLEKHPKLKRFETIADILWTNRDLFSETNIRLDLLSILSSESNTVPIIQLFDFIKTLYDRGFYKTLRLGFSSFALDNIDIATLTTISASYVLINVEEIVFSDPTKASPDKIDFFARNLTNLEYLKVYKATFDQILPFIRHLKRLKTMKICKLSNEFFNSFALNEERKKLDNAVQVTIYLPEDVYLAEIWKYKNLNLKHVKIVRYLGEGF